MPESSPQVPDNEADKAEPAETGEPGTGAAAAEAVTRQLPGTDSALAAEPKRRRVPVRRLSIVGVALAAVGVAAYLAFPGANGSANGSATGSATASGKGTGAAVATTTIPGPMPGAPRTPTSGSGSTASPGSTSTHLKSSSATGVTAQPTAGPTALRASDPAAVASWNAGAGGQALVKVTDESGNVLMAHAGKEYADMLQYCKKLSSAVTTAQKAAPIQDAAMQQKYAAALTSLQQGAAQCLTGISQVADGVEDTTINVNQPVLDAAVSEVSTGVSDLYIATGALRKQ